MHRKKSQICLFLLFAAVALIFPPQIQADNLSDYSVLATNSIHLKEESKVVSGLVGVNDQGAAPFLAGNVELVMGEEATTESGVRVSAVNIKLKEDARVKGDVHYRDSLKIQSGATVVGNKVQKNGPNDWPLVKLPPIPVCSPNASNNITVQEEKKATLQPGSYGDIKVKEEGTLTFEAGEYHMTSFSAGEETRILFNGAVTLCVDGRFKVGEESFFGPASSSSITAADIFVDVKGTNGGAGGPKDKPRAFKIGEESNFSGQVFVPNGTLVFQEESRAQGSFIAKDIIVGEEARITFVEGRDNTPPVISNVKPADGSILADATPTISADFSDDKSGVDPVSANITIDRRVLTAQATVSETGFTVQVPETLSDGLHTVTISVADRAGNTAADRDKPSAVASFTTDTFPPVVTTASVSPTPNISGWNNNDATITFTATDVTSGVANVDPPVVISTEGENIPAVGKATDKAGNEGSFTEFINLDKTSPGIQIISPANQSKVQGTETTVSGTVSDNLSGLDTVKCDGNDATVVGTDFSCRVFLKEGANVIKATATDLAGNTNDSTIVVNFNKGPDLSITSPSNFALLTSETITVTGTVSEATALVDVNGVAATVNQNNFSAQITIKEGNNTITAVGTGQNGGISTATIQVSLDTTPPTVMIESPEDGATTFASSINVAGMVNDLVIGTVNSPQCRVTINGREALVANRSFLATDVPLNVGENTILAVAIDRGGNSVTNTITVTRESVISSSRLLIISGNDQSAAIGETLQNPLVIKLLDKNSNAVPNASVVFTVAGNNGVLTSGSNSGQSLNITTDAQGQAQVDWTLGTRAGVGNHMVEVSSPGAAGVTFSAIGLNGQPDKISLDAGNNQAGIIGEQLPLPFVSIVTDAGHNRLENVPVTYIVEEGAGTFNNSSSVTVNTDSDGRAIAFLTLGLEEGMDNNVVEANFLNNQNPPAVFVASGKLPKDPAQTKVSGVVLDNTDIPIQGVTVTIEGTTLSTTTDAEGQFTLSPAPVGHVLLHVDGSTANRPGTWPGLEFEFNTVPGQDNTVGMPIYLLPLDIQNGLQVSETKGGILTLPDVPGFALEVEPGSVTFPDNTKSGVVSVTVVHADKVPMTPNFGQQPRFIVTIQPAGAHFDPPAKITIPNTDGLAPGEVTEMYSFDHDLGSFVSIGTGTVSSDGTVVTSDPGVGIVKGGWHCGGNPSQTASGAPATVIVDKTEICVCLNQQQLILATGSPTPPDGNPFEWQGATVQGFTNISSGSQSVATVSGSSSTEETVTVRYRCKSGEVSQPAQVKVKITDQDGTDPTGLSSINYLQPFTDAGDPAQYDGWGVTVLNFPLIDISTYCDSTAGLWRVRVTKADMQIAQSVLLPKEITNLTEALVNSETDCNELNTMKSSLENAAKNNFHLGYYMNEAVQAHEGLHVTNFQTAIQSHFTNFVTKVESLTVPLKDHRNAAEAKAKILSSSEFIQAQTELDAEHLKINSDEFNHAPSFDPFTAVEEAAIAERLTQISNRRQALNCQ